MTAKRVLVLCLAGLVTTHTAAQVDIIRSCGAGTASDSAGNNPEGEEPDKAFDNELGTKWLLGDPSPANTWILQYDFGAPRYVSSYDIISANDFDNRDPEAWTIQGSNDGSAWSSALDTVTGNAFAARNTTYGFTMDTPATYRYFRLYITSIVDDTAEATAMTQIAELIFKGFCNAGDAGGDPHFHTWSSRRHFTYHGHCDLVLLDSPTFGQGRGLSIHVRSSPFKSIYSYISRVAVKFGDQVFEAGKGGEYILNGQASPPLEQVLGADFKIDFSKGRNRAQNIITVQVNHNTQIDIRERNGWMRVRVETGAPAQDFSSSAGLMGSFPDGTHLGRDGLTEFLSIDEFGMEWQVKESLDGLLFQDPSPYPDKCELLSEASSALRGRRLAESSVSHQDAVKACMKWSALGDDSMDECIQDVLISEDLGTADLGY